MSTSELDRVNPLRIYRYASVSPRPPRVCNIVSAIRIVLTIQRRDAVVFLRDRRFRLPLSLFSLMIVKEVAQTRCQPMSLWSQVASAILYKLSIHHYRYAVTTPGGRLDLDLIVCVALRCPALLCAAARCGALRYIGPCLEPRSERFLYN